MARGYVVLGLLLVARHGPLDEELLLRSIRIVYARPIIDNTQSAWSRMLRAGVMTVEALVKGSKIIS